MGYYLIERVFFQIRGSFLHGYREHNELLFNYSNPGVPNLCSAELFRQ